MENTHGWLKLEKKDSLLSRKRQEIYLIFSREILVLGDEKRGLAILPKEMQKEYIARIFSEMDS